jgi:hypothetical protein
MSAISFEMINHFREINKIIKRYNLKAQIDFEYQLLTIFNSDKIYVLFPQFQNKQGEYTSELTEDTIYFIGWRPYQMKGWAIATNKELFKILLEDHHIRTPHFSSKAGDNLNDVIIKLKTSSFGVGIKGPIKSSVDYTLNKNLGEYFERYIQGEIVKIWFWNHTAYAAESKPQPKVIGNGKSTISDLIKIHAKMINKKIDVTKYLEFLSYQNLSLDTVLKKGSECPIDFRYKSFLPTGINTTDIAIKDNDLFGNKDQLDKIGFLVEHEAPPSFSKNTVYTIDAILDNNKKLWILEMNCNPWIHPYLYQPMIDTLISAENF